MRIVIYAEKRLHSFPAVKGSTLPELMQKKEKEQTFD